MSKLRVSRRRALQAGGALAGLAGTTARAADQGHKAEPNIYTRIGVQPFINLTATYTINGGALTLPEVKKAMDEASRYSVNLDELMEHVGARLATLLGGESAIVTSGDAAALAHATAACVAGCDPEKMQQLPDTTGLKNEVLIPVQARNPYDHAFRMVGIKMVEFDTPEDFHRLLSDRTAMIAVLGTAEAKGNVRLEEMVKAAKQRGIPVVVDAAAELPVVPNPYLSRGADLVGYSGGKFLRGPQCAGILLGRKDLVKAAWWNSAPHHAFGRSMKVGKEEVMGMLAAIEVWRNNFDLDAQYKTWEGWLRTIGDKISTVPGVQTKLMPPLGASPFPVLDFRWDPAKIGLTGGEINQLLLSGQPRIMSHGEGETHNFVIRPVAMKEGDAPLVARRLEEILRKAGPKPEHTKKPASTDLTGKWNIDIQFAYGKAEHTADLKAQNNTLSGSYKGLAAKGPVKGSVDGDKVQFQSAMPCQGTKLQYRFDGTVQGSKMSGTVSFGEYGTGTFTATKA